MTRSRAAIEIFAVLDLFGTVNGFTRQEILDAIDRPAIKRALGIAINAARIRKTIGVQSTHEERGN